jgi:hypothetical protein
MTSSSYSSSPAGAEGSIHPSSLASRYVMAAGKNKNGNKRRGIAVEIEREKERKEKSKGDKGERKGLW